MTRRSVLALDSAEVRFGFKAVLQGISFELGRGDILLVTGPNGAGKSTLLKLIAGAVPLTSGSLRCEPHPRVRAYMGHKTFLYPNMSALENLRFWAGIYQLDFSREKGVSFLARTGLSHVLHEPAAHFSRGMAQRLSLARALMVDPELLLLDEPGTGLDQASRMLLREEIKNAEKRGCTVVWVSHDPDTDRELADQVLSLEGGKMVSLLPGRECRGAG